MYIAWQDYNRNIAIANKIVAHGGASGDPATPRNSFFRSNFFAEVEAGTVSGIHSPYVVCAQLDGTPVGMQPALRKKVWTNMFFLAHLGDGDIDAYQALMQQTYDVMSQFIARYIRDQEMSGACGPFQKFDPANLLFQEVGPLAQNDYGWRLRVEFTTGAPELIYNPANWKS